jgi:hypothetical protein
MTVREQMEALRRGEVTLDDVTRWLREHGATVHTPAKDFAEVYQRAEEMPGDDDTFWIDSAFDQRVIDHADYRRLFDAIQEFRQTHTAE